MEGDGYRWMDFDVSQVIGAGQFSTVYRACVRNESRRPVALKRVKLFSMFDSKARSDCVQEIQLLKELNHPNIIHYLGSFLEDNGDLIIVLELAGAGDLAKLLSSYQRRQRLLSEETLWQFFTQICSAVEHVHCKRIVHRDIKPANVFLTNQMPPVLKLGDLGLGRFFTSSTVAAHSLVGTPYYMSPERLRQHGYDFSSDIWSLGCLLYEMAALQPPFFGPKMNLTALRQKIEQGQYPPIPSDHYGPEVNELVSRCLHPTPERRPPISEVLATAAAGAKFEQV